MFAIFGKKTIDQCKIIINMEPLFINKLFIRMGHETYLIHNICFIKIRSKLSSVLLLCLLRIFMKRTLFDYCIKAYKYKVKIVTIWFIRSRINVIVHFIYYINFLKQYVELLKKLDYQYKYLIEIELRFLLAFSFDLSLDLHIRQDFSNDWSNFKSVEGLAILFEYFLIAKSTLAVLCKWKLDSRFC